MSSWLPVAESVYAQENENANTEQRVTAVLSQAIGHIEVLDPQDLETSFRLSDTVMICCLFTPVGAACQWEDDL